ncbi:hypothetical protein NDN08_003332 [Rhodosorus marinus]|uniref:DJ-1/PfpI domain-containing protein n=1 Tax=Rhodosorus marinus TaxID=101924 RepID=A0AAV8V0B2_9RHOD|nr:hypothetical protein NDN08_003332 [Rhodosorus marinus]
MGKTVFILLTSANDMNGHATGFWLEELATPYYLFTEAGYDVDIVSVKGGDPPMDQSSISKDFITPDGTKFMEDSVGMAKLKSSLSVDQLLSEDKSYDIAFAAGGHGTVVDFATSAAVKKLLEGVYRKGNVVAAVCHGPAALLGLTNEDGTPLVKDKTVTGFTAEEEKGVGLQSIVPYFLDEKLKELGGCVDIKEAWSEHAVADGKLITGQNPMSSKRTAILAIEADSA